MAKSVLSTASRSGRVRPRRRTGAWLGLLLGTTLLSACSTGLLTDLDEKQRKLQQAALLLDGVAEDLDRFGTISVSTPGMVLNIGDRLAFDLDLTAQQIFDGRSFQGLSAIRSERAFAAQLKLAFQLAAAGNGDAANAALAETLVAANASSEDGNGATGGDAAETQGAAAENGKSASQAPAKPPATPAGPAGGLATPDAALLGLTLRDLIKRTFDDHMTLKLFEMLSAPNPADFGVNKRLYAAVLSVSLRPGRDTYRGHIGEVDVAITYWRKEKKTKKLVPFDGRHPIAFAAFPAVDSQALDLRRSDRNRLALELLLEAAAPRLSGSLGTSFQRLLEQDRATAETRNTLIGFNMGGRNFGWRFTPRYTAQLDPAENNAAAGNRLFEESFPALVFLLADTDDLCKSVGGTGDAQNTSAPSGENDNKSPGSRGGSETQDCADHFYVQTTVRWLRAPDPESDQSWVPFSGTISRARTDWLKESRAADWAFRLDKVFSAVNAISEDKPDGNAAESSGPHAVASLRKRYNSLVAATVGLDSFFAIPQERNSRKPSALAITGVAPTHGWIDRDTYLVVTGRGLKGSEFFVGGMNIKVSPEDVAENGKTAVLKVSPPFSPDSNGALSPGSKGALDVVVRHKETGSAVLANAVVFDKSTKDGDLKDPEKHASKIVIEWEGAGNSRRVKNLTTYGSPPPADVLKAITAGGAEGGKAEVELDLNVKSGGGTSSKQNEGG